MDHKPYSNAHHAFIEQFGLQFESSGIPRMAGRMFGLLLISDPPALTAKEMMAILDASSSSISSMMRILLQLQLVEQVSISGERAKRYRIHPAGWSQLIMSRLMGVLHVRDLLAQGQALLQNEDEALQNRIQEMGRFYAFMQQELEQMAAKWQTIEHQNH